ncbi:MAG: beta strand repeat-containing protein [Thermoleophilia bacterium]
MKVIQHEIKRAVKPPLGFIVLGLALVFLILSHGSSASADTTVGTTGGGCSTIGTWNPATLTCTLTGDVVIASGNGININGAGITLDGAGHAITGSMAYTTGIAISSSNVTLKNLTVNNFMYGAYVMAASGAVITGDTFSGNGYGVYLSVANSARVYNNNLLGNTTQIYQSGGAGDLFSQPAPAGGNFYSNYNTAAQGCVDNNADGFCDTGYTFTGGVDNMPRTGAYVSSGSAPDTTAPTVTNIQPAGTVGTTSATISADYADNVGGSGVNTASSVVYLDGMAVAGCTATVTRVSCPVTALADGSHALTVSVADNAGNTGSGTGSFSVDTTAPAVTNIQPSGAISTNSATIRAYLNDAGSGLNASTVTVQMDNATLAGCTVNAGTVSCPVTGLANGTHAIAISADDNVGNHASASASFTVAVDLTPPMISGLAPSGWINTTSTTITGNYSDSGSGIDAASASVYLDSGTLSGCTATASSISCPASGLANGLHNYSVSVRDLAGNLATSTGSFSVDLTAPILINLSPSDAINATAATISATYSDGSGSGIDTASVRVYLDGNVGNNCTAGQSTVSCPTTGLAQGAHTFSVSVKDLAGNTGTASGSFTVDSVAPAVSGIAPTGTVSSASVTIYANYADSGSGINSSSAAVYLDGSTTRLSGCTATATSISCPTTGLAQGAHTFSVSVKDLAGNTGTASGSFTVDSVAPAVSGIAPTGTVSSASVTIYANYADSGSGINSSSAAVYLDGSTTRLSGCTATATSISCPVTGLADGSHTITVSVADNAGNTGTASGSFTVASVDTTPPSITSIEPTGTIMTDSATVQVYYTETGSGISSAASYVYLDSVLMTGCTYTSTVVNCPITGLLQGSHTITGRIYDNAGNYADIASTSFTVNVSNKPDLVLQVNGTAQLSGTQLQIPMRVHNAGSKTAYTVRLTADTNSDGVTYTKSGLPYSVASKISSGSNSNTFTLTYDVPAGITSFFTYCTGTAANSSEGGGTTFNYSYWLQTSGYGSGGGDN